MSALPRQARVRALAKLNLCLEVLDKRDDGFHNLRTIFQTISLRDDLHIEFTPSRRTRIELEFAIDIPNNLVIRAAEAVMEAGKVRGHVRFRLEKHIPMGGGLGGGSTDAAAVLLALPVLSGARLSFEKLLELGAELGSDVPCFLLGGTLLGVGRGTELYPLSGTGAANVLLLSPLVHSSTAEAYGALKRTSDYVTPHNKCALLSYAMASGVPWAHLAENDFEDAIFRTNPALPQLRAQLEDAGAKPARMTGSGSSIFGVFDSTKSLDNARAGFAVPAEKVSFVSRRQYQRMWMKQLAEHVVSNSWPPQSRYG